MVKDLAWNKVGEPASLYHKLNNDRFKDYLILIRICCNLPFRWGCLITYQYCRIYHGMQRFNSFVIVNAKGKRYIYLVK